MAGRGYAEWIDIQKNTTKNWVNEQLKVRKLEIVELRTDFCDGVCLVALVEVLQRRKIKRGIFLPPRKEYHKLQNITNALEAISDDNVRLVNIDSSHIREGNVKMILALLWQLILRYQIGIFGYNHKEWMLAWLRAVLPQCHITNFTTDWNSGKALHALIEFCREGACPQWDQLNEGSSMINCKNAMILANRLFHIPLVLRPEDMSSPELDEMSSITYLSYYLASGSPGYQATLRKLRKRLNSESLTNFTSDWRDGLLLCTLAQILGGDVPGWPNLPNDSTLKLRLGLEAGKRLGVTPLPLLSAEDIVTRGDVASLGIMAYAAQFLNVEQPIVNEKVILFNGTDRSETLSTLSEPTTKSEHGSEISLPGSMRSVPRSTSSLPRSTSSLPRSIASFRLSTDLADGFDHKFDTFSVGLITNNMILDEDCKIEDVQIEARAPSGRMITASGKSLYKTKFIPTEIGVWWITIYYAGRKLETLSVNVCDPSLVRVFGLDEIMPNKTHDFTIDLSKAGDGNLTVTIEHNNRKVPAYVTAQGRNSYNVSFTPWSGGLYNVEIMFNNVSIGDLQGVAVDPDDFPRNVIFTSSVGPEDDYLAVKVNCEWQIDYVTGVPYFVHVTDPSKVRIRAPIDGSLFTLPELLVDCSEAGDADVRAEVMYKGILIPARVLPEDNKAYRIFFSPEGTGTYQIRIFYNGQEIPGSPVTQELAAFDRPSVRGDGLLQGELGKLAFFIVDPRKEKSDLNITIKGPNTVPKCSAERRSDGTSKVMYTPTEVGHYSIIVELGNKHIEGSPFYPNIVAPKEVKFLSSYFSKSKMNGAGVMNGFTHTEGTTYPTDHVISSLMVGEETKLHLDTAHAGTGKLSADISGHRSKVSVAIETQVDGQATIAFTPIEEGNHTIQIYWSGYPITASPIIGHAQRAGGKTPPSPRGKSIAMIHRPAADQVDGPLRPVAPKVVLLGNGLVKAQVLKEAVFKVDGTRAGPGVPLARMTSVRSDTAIKMKQISPSVYECRYTPEVAGAYLLDIHWNDRQLKGAPFKVNVLPPSHAHRVKLSGANRLKGAQVGTDIDLKIDPREAQSNGTKGVLTALCIGPTKKIVETNLMDNFDGTFQLKIKPTEVGKHKLDIKYGGDHIYGSPYRLIIEANPSAGDVRVSGPGISDGNLGAFNSQFTVDASRAGEGYLNVRVTGPRGAFRVQIQRSTQRDKVFVCRYAPGEAGIYTVNIMWSDTHILNSPFRVRISDNEQGSLKSRPVTPMHRRQGPSRDIMY